MRARWLVNRERKQTRRRRQWERDKTMSLMSKNNASARAFYYWHYLVHFFAVPCKATTSNDQITGFVENVNIERFSFLFLFKLEKSVKMKKKKKKWKKKMKILEKSDELNKLEQ